MYTLSFLAVRAFIYPIVLLESTTGTLMRTFSDNKKTHNKTDQIANKLPYLIARHVRK